MAETWSSPCRSRVKGPSQSPARSVQLDEWQRDRDLARVLGGIKRALERKAVFDASKAAAAMAVVLLAVSTIMTTQLSSFAGVDIDERINSLKKKTPKKSYVFFRVRPFSYARKVFM